MAAVALVAIIGRGDRARTGRIGAEETSHVRGLEGRVTGADASGSTLARHVAHVSIAIATRKEVAP